MIRKLRNALLNFQQMSAQEAAHLVLSMPLNQSFRRRIFINTRLDDDHIFVLKSVKELRDELDESENVMTRSTL